MNQSYIRCPDCAAELPLVGRNVVCEACGIALEAGILPAEILDDLPRRLKNMRAREAHFEKKLDELLPLLWRERKTIRKTELALHVAGRPVLSEDKTNGV